MTDLIKCYEQQFGNLTAEVTAKISEFGRNNREGGDLSDLESIRSNLKNLISEANEVLEQYELEIRETSATEKKKLTIRLKSYKNEMARLEKEARNASDQAQQRQSRDQLLGATLSGDDNQYDDEQALLTSERIERGSNRLRDAKRVAVESEEIGVDILTNLARDRETINRSRARVRDTEMNLSSSSRILSGMLRRAMQNRIILFGLIGALIFFIFLMIYMHFRS